MKEIPWELICFVSVALVVFFFKCFYYIMRCREKEQQVVPATQAADIKQNLGQKGSDKAEGVHPACSHYYQDLGFRQTHLV